MVLKSFEWAFIIKELLRKYESTKNPDAPTVAKKHLSISSVLFDAFDLLCNLQGIGWLWSQELSPQAQSTAPTSESIPFVFASLLLNITVFDASQYLIHRVFPTIGSNPSGGSSSTRTSIFSHAMGWLLSPVYVAASGHTRTSKCCIVSER